MAALEATKAVCPDALLTMHMTPSGDLPRSFVDAIDFYMFQSGHHVERQDRPYTLAEKFLQYPVKRPIVNAEPPYEGHGRVGSPTRFSAFDVRKATWQSLLSGAKMGVTYGAHGVWSCHRRGMDFLNKAAPLSRGIGTRPCTWTGRGTFLRPLAVRDVRLLRAGAGRCAAE